MTGRVVAFATIAVAVLACAAPASSQYDPDAEMGRLIEDMDRDDPVAFERVARAFFEGALAGDLDAMMGVTSDVTIEYVGRQKLMDHYRSDTIRGLKACAPRFEGGEAIHVTDQETGTGSGWVFRKHCTAAGNESHLVHFVVLREGGKIALAGFGAE